MKAFKIIVCIVALMLVCLLCDNHAIQAGAGAIAAWIIWPKADEKSSD